MKYLLALFACAILGITAFAVASVDTEKAKYDSQTQVAQAQSQGTIALAESQEAIAGYQAAVEIADITAQLELARLQMEVTRLASQIESEKIQVALAQTNALLTQGAIDLENAKTERTRLMVMLVIPAMAVIAVVFVVLVLAVLFLRRPAQQYYYPRITIPSSEIVTTKPVHPGVIMATFVGKKKDVDHYAVRR